MVSWIVISGKHNLHSIHSQLVHFLLLFVNHEVNAGLQCVQGSCSRCFFMVIHVQVLVSLFGLFAISDVSCNLQGFFTNWHFHILSNSGIHSSSSDVHFKHHSQSNHSQRLQENYTQLVNCLHFYICTCLFSYSRT